MVGFLGFSKRFFRLRARKKARIILSRLRPSFLPQKTPPSPSIFIDIFDALGIDETMLPRIRSIFY